MKCTPDVPSQTLQTGGLDVIRVEARAVCAGKPGAAISRNIQNIHGTFGSDMVRVGGEGRRRGGGGGTASGCLGVCWSPRRACEWLFTLGLMQPL